MNTQLALHMKVPIGSATTTQCPAGEDTLGCHVRGTTYRQIVSSTHAIDNEITDNFYTVTSTVVGYTLLFGFVAVVLALLWKGIRTLMGKV